MKAGRGLRAIFGGLAGTVFVVGALAADGTLRPAIKFPTDPEASRTDAVTEARIRTFLFQTLAPLPESLLPERLNFQWITQCEKAEAILDCNADGSACWTTVNLCAPPANAKLAGLPWSGALLHEVGHGVFQNALHAELANFRNVTRDQCVAAGGDPWPCYQEFQQLRDGLDELFADAFAALLMRDPGIIPAAVKDSRSRLATFWSGAARRDFAKPSRWPLSTHDPHNYFSEVRPTLWKSSERRPSALSLPALLRASGELLRQVGEDPARPERRRSGERLGELFARNLRETL
jgi:hypothetical protein